jgi:tetratricopeptide (TPR) repeat protein
MLRRTVSIILLALLPAVLFAQVSSGSAQLREGLQLFKEARYQDAIGIFRGIIVSAERQRARENAADAYYWLSRAYLALDNYEEAAKNLEYFLASFPSHPYYPDALYQKGRLLYLQGDPQSAIQVLESFVRSYPDSEYAGNAYFWVGECLFSLGHLDQAARVFNKVDQEYPTSAKIEAARYRLSMIEFKKREDELLKLLKWSHEEALKSVEEFRQREKAYEQAIEVYRRRLSEAAPAQAPARAEIETLRSTNEDLRRQIAELEAQRGSAPAGPGVASEETARRLQALRNREAALQLKEDALAVKESLLRSMSEDQEGQ